jgi:hypothetical protein
MIKHIVKQGKRFIWCAVICMATSTRADDLAAIVKNEMTVCDALVSKDTQERANAARMLTVRKGELVNCLLAKLKIQIAEPKQEFGGPFQKLAIVLGDLRATAAVPDLLSVIDVRLTGAPPIGGFGGPELYYPAAIALGDIGGPNLVDGLFQRLGKPASDDEIRIRAWVLVRAYSEPVARLIVQMRLERITAVLKRIGVTDTNPEKRNLERMQQILDRNEPLVPEPGAATAGGGNSPSTPAAGPFGRTVPK